MNRKHPFWKEKLESVATIRVETAVTKTIPEAISPQPLNDCQDTLEDDHNNKVPDDADYFPADDPRVTAGKISLVLKECHRMSQTAISFAIESVKKLITPVIISKHLPRLLG